MKTRIDERGDRISDETKVVSQTAPKARQGNIGRPILYVLVGALVLVAVGWIAVESYGESVDNDAVSDVKQTSQGAKAVVTSPNQKVIDNTPTAGEKVQSAPTDRDPTAESGTGGSSQSLTPTGTEKTR